MDIQKTGHRQHGRVAMPPSLIREKALLGGLPFGKTTLWKLVKEGRFPRPTKLSSRVTVWKIADVERWLAGLGAGMGA